MGIEHPCMETDNLSPSCDCADGACLNPNPPKDTDGRREESGRGVRELQGK